MTTLTYFVQRGGDGPVKIGVTGNLTSRLESLQTASPEVLRVLGVLVGNHEEEMHQKFAAHRLMGEWFAPAAELLAEAKAADIWTAPVYRQKRRPGDNARTPRGLTLEEAVDAFRAEYIRDTLERNNGNRSATARELNVDIRTIFRYVKSCRYLGVNVPPATMGIRITAESGEPAESR